MLSEVRSGSSLSGLDGLHAVRKATKINIFSIMVSKQKVVILIYFRHWYRLLPVVPNNIHLYSDYPSR